MALCIRLQPTGRKKVATYRVVIQEKRSKLTGKCVDILGFYNAQTHPVSISIDKDKAKAWIAKGAQPSPIISVLLEKENFMFSKATPLSKPAPVGTKKSKQKKEKEQKQAGELAAQQAAAEAAAKQAEVKEEPQQEEAPKQEEAPVAATTEEQPPA